MKTKLLASLFGLALVLALVGCVNVPRAQLEAEVARIGYGDDLAPGYEEKVKAAMELRLKDPASAIYRFGDPYKNWQTKAAIDGGQLDKVGWCVPVLINAKNSYGGYTGFQPYRVWFRDNRVIAVEPHRQ